MTYKNTGTEDIEMPNYYDGDFEMGVKKGKGRRQNPDGSKYDGEYKDNKPHG